MKKNWFNRLLLSYLPVFFIITLSLLLMTFLTLTEMSKQASVEANNALSHNISKLIDSKLADIDSLMIYEIQNNEKIKQFFSDNPKENRHYADIQASAAIKELLQNNPTIDSIYLYRAPDQTILSPSTLSRLNDFADSQFIGVSLNSRVPYNWTARTMQPGQTGGNDARSVVSLAKNTNLSNLSILIVNIRNETLREWIASMSDNNSTFVRLSDRQGNLIVSTEAGADGSASGKKADRVLSSAVSDQTGWVISSGTFNSGILEFVSSLFYVWMGIASVIVIAGVTWIIYVSRRQYKPVMTLMNMISGARNTSPAQLKTEKVDEFEFIESSIEELLDESNMLQEQHKELSVYHRRHLFLSLMEDSNATANFGKYLEEELSRLGIDQPVSGSLVAIVEIDHFAEFANQYGSDQHLLKYILGASVKELVENKPFTVWTEWISSSKMGVLFLFHQQQCQQEVLDCCEKLRDWVAHNLDFTVTIGVGPHIGQLELTAESFREAINAVGYKSSLGTNRLITPDHVVSKPKGELFKQLQVFRSISQSFRLGDDKWESYYEEMYQTLRNQLYTHDDLASLMQVLIGYLQKEMAELNEELNNYWIQDVQPAMLMALEEETQDEVYRVMYDILKDAFEKLNKLRENKSSHQLMHQVKQFIAENYNNPDLSLTQLSEEFGLNAKYLSRLFRDAFGMKFVEYVSEVRMEKAEQLLLETEETIQEIGRLVGYDQSLTFIRVFKKHTGETPGQFRKKNSAT